MADVERVGGIELRAGDQVSADGSSVTRAGYDVTQREVLVPLEWGMEVIQDHVVDSDGNAGRRKWVNFPNGAVMALPYRREEGQAAGETTLYLAKDLQLYGIGDSSGIEAMDAIKRRKASSTALEILHYAGLEARRVAVIGKINETSGRQQNWTDIVAVSVDNELTEEALEVKKLLAVSFDQAQDLIRSGKIQNAATISALWFLGEFLKDEASHD